MLSAYTSSRNGEKVTPSLLATRHGELHTVVQQGKLQHRASQLCNLPVLEQSHCATLQGWIMDSSGMSGYV